MWWASSILESHFRWLLGGQGVASTINSILQKPLFSHPFPQVFPYRIWEWGCRGLTLVGLVCHSWKILKKGIWPILSGIFFWMWCIQHLGLISFFGGKVSFNLLYKEEHSNKSVLSMEQCILSTESSTIEHNQEERGWWTNFEGH